jgi:hypothetical protein
MTFDPYWFEATVVFMIGAGYPAEAIISRTFMYAEDGHVAHPRLYGAPAFARPPLSVMPAARPLDPDDLPITAQQTAEERALIERLLGGMYAAADAADPLNDT